MTTPITEDEIRSYYRGITAASNEWQGSGSSFIEAFYQRFPFTPQMEMAEPNFSMPFDIEGYFGDIAPYIKSDREAMREHNPRLNIWMAVGIGENELKHCAFLAWLFDPEGDHGQRELFLKCFFSYVPELRHLVALLDKDCVRVIREDSYGEDGRVDIYIKSKWFLVLIEAKFRAAEQQDQVGRCNSILLSDAAARGIVRANALTIFLTIDGRKPITGIADVCLSWSAVVSALKNSVGECRNALIRSIVMQYRQFILHYI